MVDKIKEIKERRNFSISDEETFAEKITAIKMVKGSKGIILRKSKKEIEEVEEKPVKKTIKRKKPISFEDDFSWCSRSSPENYPIMIIIDEYDNVLSIDLMKG